MRNWCNKKWTLTSVYHNGECENDQHVLAKGREDMTSESQEYYVELLYFTHLVESFVAGLDCDISGSQLLFPSLTYDIRACK